MLIDRDVIRAMLVCVQNDDQGPPSGFPLSFFFVHRNTDDRMYNLYSLRVNNSCAPNRLIMDMDTVVRDVQNSEEKRIQVLDFH